jgi:hypothetical protein
MTKFVALFLSTSVLIAASDYGYNGSTTAVVTLVGGVIKSAHVDKEKKYPRKDCPVCKGKGWYISGDGIKKVDCGYCEPDKTEGVIHDAINIVNDKKCSNPNCKCKNCECENCGCLPSVE